MPKKTRKMKQRASERRTVPIGPGEATGAMPSAETSMRTRADLAAARTTSALTYDYSYIYGDLRRIALFASFFFVVLIALSFIIK